MIAASEEFLREIAPVIRDGGDLNATHLLVAALDAGTRLYPNLVTASRGVSHTPFYWLMYAMKLPRSDCGESPATDWVTAKMRDAIALGMPFVGWSINADSRRISGPAQPGEGEFVKYLGRDF